MLVEDQLELLLLIKFGTKLPLSHYYEWDKNGNYLYAIHYEDETGRFFIITNFYNSLDAAWQDVLNQNFEDILNKVKEIKNLCPTFLNANN